MSISLTARLLGQTALVTIILSSSAFAQEAAIELDPIIKTVDGDGTGPVDGIANVKTQTGSKTATPLNEIPQSVSVIGAEILTSQNITKVDEALRYSAGVFTQPFGDDSDTNWHFIRGFQSTQTGVYQDGLQNYSYAFGGFFTDAYSLERIEILRGAASVLYGGSNSGGILNLVTKRPGGHIGETIFGINDAGTAWVNFDIGENLDDGAAWRLTGRVEGGEKYDAFADGFRGFLAPSMSFTTEGGTDITILANYLSIDEKHSGGSFLPYNGTVVPTSQFGFIDPKTNFSEPGLDSNDRDQFTISALANHEFANGWTLNANARLGWSDVEESSLYAYGYAGFSATPTDAAGTMSRIYFQHQTTTRTALADVSIQGDVDAGELQHHLLFGVDAKWFELDQIQASANQFGGVTGVTAINPIYGSAQPNTVPYINQVTTQTQVGLYAQDQIRWGEGWIATLNARYDFANTESGINSATGAAGSDRSDGELTWRAGIAHEFSNGLTPYASVATYFNPQIITDAGGNAVYPETGTQYEVGLKWAPEGDNTLLTLSFYDLRRQGVLQSVWNGAGYDYLQIAEQRSRGVEFEIKHDFENGLTLMGSATRMNLEITEDSDATIVGNTPYNVPETMAAINLQYAFGGNWDGLSLGGGLRYYGSSWADNANTLPVPSVLLADIQIRYKWDDWTATLAVSNVADETYVASCQGQFSCAYGAGREVSFALIRHW